jgi:hypothetical protein
MLFSWDPEVGDADHWDIHHNRCLMVRDDVNLWPLGEVVHTNQEILISALTLREGSYNKYGYPLKWFPYLGVSGSWF